MLRIFRRTALVLVLSSVCACSDPLQVEIPRDSSHWNEVLKPLLKKLSSDDAALVTRYLERQMNPIAEGGTKRVFAITVGEAILEQRQYEQDQAALQEELAKYKRSLQELREAAVAKAENSLSVELIGFAFVRPNLKTRVYHYEALFEIAITNISAVGISGFKGLAQLTDVFGEKIVDLSIEEDSPIGPKVRVVRQIKTQYPNFDDTAIRLAKTRIEATRFKFSPGTVVFADGSKVEVPQHNQ